MIVYCINTLSSRVEDLELDLIKKLSENCKKIIAGFVTATIAESFSPIPISDSLMLIPTQVAMMTSITITFKVKVSKSILTALASTIISTIGATILGKTIASTIFKVIPGVGTFIGGSISSAIAGTLTTAMGMAYLKIMILVYKGEIDINELSNEKVIELMKKTFEEEYKKSKKNKYSLNNNYKLLRLLILFTFCE